MKSFGECERFVQTQIPTIYAGFPVGIAADVPELTRERLREGGGVEPVVNPMRAARISNLIATLREGDEKTQRIVTKYGEGEAFLEGGNACDFPPANGGIGHFVHTTTEALSAAQRQLIHVAGHEPVGYVEVRLLFLEASPLTWGMSGTRT